MWYLMLISGVHPTLTGVLLAFAVPFRQQMDNAPSYKLQHYLVKPVGFVVLPLFALANTAIPIGIDEFGGLFSPYGMGVLCGLLLGKPIGIMLFTFAAIWLGISTKPKELKWRYIFGVSLLAGIGFTMSIFIALLSFDSYVLVSSSKVAVLLASLLAGVLGYIWLNVVLPKQKNTAQY